MLNAHYALITSAYNECATLPVTVRAILGQTIPPCRWLLIDDGSCDGTGDLAEALTRDHAFVEVHRRPAKSRGDIRSKEAAIRWAWSLLGGQQYDFVGITDADIEVSPDYFEQLMAEFADDPKLGLISGWIAELVNGDFRPRLTNRRYSVPGAAQLFRFDCYSAVAECPVLPYGGMDWWQQVEVERLGWAARTVEGLEIRHFRRSSSAHGIVKGLFVEGRRDCSFGSAFWFELAKCVLRLFNRPAVIGSAAMLFGYMAERLPPRPLAVSEDFVRFIRSQQRARAVQALRLAGVA